MRIVRPALAYLWIGLKMLCRGIAVGFRMAWRYRWGRRCIYGTAVLLLWMTTIYGMILFNVMGLNTYEQGWRAGNLASLGVSDRVWLPLAPPGTLFPTGEGFMLLGDSSSRGASLNGRQISPSHFSTNYRTYEAGVAMLGKPVAMQFRQLIHRWFLTGTTDIRVDKFVPLVAQDLPKDCTEAHGWLAKAYQNVSGKVVEAARVGSPWLWKTQEIMVYAGGNEFTELSIINPSMFECAVMALKSGETVTILYDDQAVRDPVTQNTTFNMVKISDQK